MSTYIFIRIDSGPVSQRNIVALKACAIKKQAEAEKAEQIRKAKKNAARQRTNPKFSKDERKRLSRFKLQAIEKERELNEMRIESQNNLAEAAESDVVTVASTNLSSEKKIGFLDFLNGALLFMQRVTWSIK